MGQVATVKTTASPGQALGAILAALPAGAPMVAGTMIAAQSAVETAGWKSMNNWNMGNVTPTNAQAQSGDWMSQGIQGMKYISFPNILAGAQAMVGWVQGHGLLSAAYAGDLSSYVNGLRAGSYLGTIGLTDPTGHTVSQSDYDNYQAGIATWMAKLASVTPIYPSWWSLLSNTDIALGGAAVVVTAAASLAFVRPDILEQLKEKI